MKRSFFALFGVLVLLLAAIPAFAQETTSSIQGTVTDQSGAALPGVSIEAVNEKGQRYSTATDSIGHYRLPAVTPGTYTVTASLAGMEPANVRNMTIVLGASPKVDLKLRLGTVKESVTVTAEAPVVDVTQSAKSTSIRAEQFEKLPKGRDFTTVVVQAAGANQEDRAAGISIDGATGLENRFVVDGVDTTEPRLGTSSMRVITDVIEEVQVKSSGYEAEFGGATGGVINVITKSGTNEFKGNVNSYYRDNSWNGKERPTLQSNASGLAPEYVTFRKDDYKILEPGASVGGPVLRDHLWFFGSYQPSRTRLNRTVSFSNPGTFPATSTFPQHTNRENDLLNFNGNFGARQVFKIAGSITKDDTKNAVLPGRSGRGGADPTLYNGQQDIYDTNTFSGYYDFIPTQSVYLSARGGRLYENTKQRGYPADEFKTFYRGSNDPSQGGVFANVPASLVRPAGFSNNGGNSATDHDKYTRNNFALEGSYFANFVGTHSFKVGAQQQKVNEDIISGTQSPNYRFQWARGDRFLGGKGTYGSVAVYMFQTLGSVDNYATSVFAQDSWSTLNNRLTLNIGVRTEREKIPQYSTDPTLPKYAIDWGFGDKVAPRFGFAYDFFGNGRSKIYGSFGHFYDIMKLGLARAAFGGDKWLWHAFTLETADWANFHCTGVSNEVGTKPTCNSGSYIGSIDLRQPDLSSIDPNLKPMKSEEFTLGGQQEIGDRMSVGVRFVHKQLLRAIEDLGNFVDNGNGQFAESYVVGNPGFGLSKTQACSTCPGIPKATRKYDGLEFEFTKRFTNRWGAHATYLYSRLRGNYPGLANEDEAGTSWITPRVEPNVSRWGDFVETVYSAKGGGASAKSNEGRLPTDRPHQLKAQVSYTFPVGTTLGVNQYLGSGTPISTVMYVRAAEFYPFGRGDLGRTPWLKQTDFFIGHRFPISRYGLEISANVLNLFDSKTTAAVYPVLSQDNVYETAAGNKNGGQKFFNGFNAAEEVSRVPGDTRPTNCTRSSGTVGAGSAPIADHCLSPDVLYKSAIGFQNPREVRLQVKFTF